MTSPIAGGGDATHLGDGPAAAAEAKHARSNAPLFWGLIAGVIVGDVVTKAWAVRALVPKHVPHQVFGDVLRFTLVHNPGAAFGLNLGTLSRWIFMALTLGALVVLGRLYRATRPGDAWRTLALGLVCGGAVGNLIDRVRSAEGVVDNGGMLTTVGDWLKWNAALDAKTFGAPFVEALETQGVLNDGRKISYALGLDVGSYKGIKEIAHSGGTAGYQTYLARFPEKKLSAAAMCNGYPPAAGDIVHSVVDELFGPFPAAESVASVTVAEEQLKKYAGAWRSEKTRNVNHVTVEKGELKINGGPLKPVAEGAFMLGDRKVKFIANNEGVPEAMEIANTDGSIIKLRFEPEWKPTDADLNGVAGEWYSEEAQSRISITVENGKAFLTLRPVIRFQLDPAYKDAFSGDGYIMWFKRDKSGNATELHVGGSRMRDMLFVRGH